MSYTTESGTVAVHGTTLPGTVVQVRDGRTVVKSAGTYALRMALPVSLVASAAWSGARRTRPRWPKATS